MAATHPLPLAACGIGALLLAPALSAQTLQIDGESSGDRFGSAVATLPDLNGDGIADLVVGAPGSDLAGTNAGAVYLLSGADGAVLRTHDGTGVDQRHGFLVCSAGDANGDGVADYAAAEAPGGYEIALLETARPPAEADAPGWSFEAVRMFLGVDAKATPRANPPLPRREKALGSPLLRALAPRRQLPR